MRKSGTLLHPRLASPSRLSSPCPWRGAGGRTGVTHGPSPPMETQEGARGGRRGKKYGTPRWEGRVQVQTTDLLKRFQTARPPLDFPISLPLIPQLPPPRCRGWRLLRAANYPALRNRVARARVPRLRRTKMQGWQAEPGGERAERGSSRCALLQPLHFRRGGCT